jgi:predicted RNA binding protein YcfA (HicA-like mRNA interferase family)
LTASTYQNIHTRYTKSLGDSTVVAYFRATTGRGTMGRVVSSAEIMAALRADGWGEVKGRSGTSHRQFRHPAKPGRVSVPHPVKEMPVGTIKSIERQSGLKLR